MPEFLVNQIDHLIDGQTLPQFCANKVFFLFGPPGHVTGTIDQEQLPAPAAGTSEISSYEFYSALKGRIAAVNVLITRQLNVPTRNREEDQFRDNPG